MKEEANKDDIKAVKRTITNIYTKGTCSGVSEICLNDINKAPNQTDKEDEQEAEQNDQRESLFESRYILFFIRATNNFDSKVDSPATNE